MIISDSTPIQFWDIDEDTFNELQPICGLTADCFCLPVNCSQPIPIQFTDTELRDYRITFYDTDDSEIIELSFDSQQVGDLWVYSLTFTPQADLGVCNQKIYGKISYYENTMSGAITDVIELVDGDLENIPEPTEEEAEFYTAPDDCPSGVLNTVFYTGAFAPGTTLYQDAGLTTPWTGEHYVSQISGDGSIFAINPSTGVIGADTGFDC